MVYSTRRFVLCLILCHFVLAFFSPFSIAITSLGEERANLSAFQFQLLSDRQHAFRKRHSCETQLTTVINDWVKSWIREDRLTHLFWTSRKLLTPRLMNFLKANYLVMALVERHSGV